MATSVLHWQVGHFVHHVGGFCQWVDNREHFKNDFLFLGVKFAMKSILRPKQNVGTKSAFFAFNKFKQSQKDK